VGRLSAGAGIGALGAELRVAMPVCGGMARWGLGTFKKERLLLQRNKRHDERSQGYAWAACLRGVGASGIYLSPGLLRVVPEASGGPLPQPLMRGCFAGGAQLGALIGAWPGCQILSCICTACGFA
jgi:hypothetical protein